MAVYLAHHPPPSLSLRRPWISHTAQGLLPSMKIPFLELWSIVNIWLHMAITKKVLERIPDTYIYICIYIHELFCKLHIYTTVLVHCNIYRKFYIINKNRNSSIPFLHTSRWSCKPSFSRPLQQSGELMNIGLLPTCQTILKMSV